MLQRTDVFIIGGGPAGLAAAIAARERGFDVVVADGAEPPIDKGLRRRPATDAVEVSRALVSRSPPQTDSLYKAFAFLMPS